MSSEAMGKRVDELYKNLDVDSRIKAIENLLEDYGKRRLSGENTESIDKNILEIKDTVPEWQVREFNQKILISQQNEIKKSKDLHNLIFLWEETRILKFRKLFLLYALYEFIIKMQIAKQVKEGRSDVISIAQTVFKSPFWFISSPDELERIYKEKVEYPEGICYLFLTSKLEDAEIGLLPQGEQDKIAKLEAEMEALPEDEENDDKWSEPYDKKMSLIPFTKKAISDDNEWSALHKYEKELIKEFQELAKIYDASFAERIKDIDILSPDLVYELIEIFTDTCIFHFRKNQ
jgi:hypothetical protein